MSNVKRTTKRNPRQTPAASTKGANARASAPTGATARTPKAGSKRTHKEMDSGASTSTPLPPSPRRLRNRVILPQPPSERPSKRTKAVHSGAENTPIPPPQFQPHQSTSDIPITSTRPTPTSSTPTMPARAASPILDRPNRLVARPRRPPIPIFPPTPISHYIPTAPQARPIHAAPGRLDTSADPTDLPACAPSPAATEILPDNPTDPPACPPSPAPTEVLPDDINVQYRRMLEGQGIKVRDFVDDDKTWLPPKAVKEDTLIVETTPTTTREDGRVLRKHSGKVWSQVEPSTEPQASTSTSTPIEDSNQRVTSWLASDPHTGETTAGPQSLQRQSTQVLTPNASPRKLTNRRALARMHSNSMLVAVQ
ncbi:hypothetical protein OF83DRAFT_631293 [Amylostereum chailletii]|nr:hypothetical protein OF83DRAFT_631293 [Amylostereum chailletii]